MIEIDDESLKNLKWLLIILAILLLLGGGLSGYFIGYKNAILDVDIKINSERDEFCDILCNQTTFGFSPQNVKNNYVVEING